MIKKHMFPLNIALPRYRETALVSAANKISAVMELLHSARALGIPFSVLIDADGTVRAMHLGVATEEGRLDALDDIRKKSLFGQPFRAPKGLFA